MTEFAKRLRQAREAAKLSQEQVASEINISRSNISKYENGELEPNIETIKKFMKLYNIPSSYLFEDSDENES